MSSILGSERKPNATARCEQLIVDGSLQVAGLYIDGTAVGGGAELAAISVGNDDGLVTYDSTTNVYSVDVAGDAVLGDLKTASAAGISGILNFNGLNFVVDADTTKVVTDLVTINTAADAGTLVYDGTDYLLKPESTESFFKASGHDVGVIKWAKGNYHGTAMTVTDGQSALSTGGGATDKYLVEVCAALKVPANTDVEQLTLLIKQGATDKGVAYYSGRATTGAVTQNVYCNAVVDGGAADITVEAFQQTAAGAAVVVTVDVAGTSVSCRKFR